MRARTVIVFFTLSIFAASAWLPRAHAGDDEVEPPIMEIDFVSPAEKEKMAKLKFGSDETISVDFPDEEVRAILKNVADIYNLNLVIPDKLKGKTSIKLRNVTWRQIFEVVLEPLSYTYVEDRNIIKIKHISELVSEPTVTRIFLINYAKANAIQTALSPLVDQRKGGRVQVDQRTNSLIVTERPSRMNDIQAIIERLDRPDPLVQIEAKLFEVINRDSWSGDEHDEDDEGDAEEVARQNGSTYAPQEAAQLFSQLETIKGARLASSFSVIVLDEHEATIEMVKRIPAPSYLFNDEQGSLGVDGIQHQEIDVKMTVRPDVNSAGLIRLHILPEITTRLGEVSISSQAGHATMPVTSTKRMSSEIILRDGFTVLLGGMSESIDQHGIVPNHSAGPQQASPKQVEKFSDSKFMIFVTARTLNPDGVTYRSIADPRELREMGIVDAEIPGYEIPEDQRTALKEIRDMRNERVRNDTERELQEILSDELKASQAQAEEHD